MRKALGFALASLIGFVNVPADAGTKLVIAYEDKEQFPDFLGNSTAIDPVKPGIHVELVKMTAAELGVELELVRLPWKRSLEDLKQGKIDGLFSGSFKEDRLEIGAYPMKDGKPDSDLRIGRISYSLYRKKGSPVSWDGKAISGLNGSVGAPVGYSIVDDLKKMKVEVQESTGTAQDLQLLKAGRIGAAAALEIVADAILKKAGNADVEKVVPPLATKDYFLLLSHQLCGKNADFCQKFWTTMAKIQAAKIGELAAKYAE